MTKFHINPETKEIGRCTASVQECRYGAVPHFENIQDAYEMSEKMLKEEYGTFNSIEQTIEKSNNIDDPNEPQKEKFAEPISKGHRAYRNPDEYFNENDYINYYGEVQKIEEIKVSSDVYGDYNYAIITNKNTIEISDYEWKGSDSLDISILKDSPNSDFLNEFPPGYTGSHLSDYVSKGDSIEYNGETYQINDFEYNRALLSYELDTDKGTIYIHDDDWYHDSKIRLLK